MNSSHALRRKRFAPILGIKHRRAQLPDAEIIIGVDANLAVVRRPWIGIAHLLPGFAFVLATIRSALLVLHDAVNAQPDAAGVPAILIREAFGQLLPVDAAIRDLIDRAVRSAAIKSKRRP